MKEFNTSVLLQVFHAEDPNNPQSSNELLGQVEIMLRELEDAQNKSRWWKLGPPKDKYAGEIRLTLQYCVRCRNYLNPHAPYYLFLQIHSFLFSFQCFHLVD